jgi:predicted nucleotidyltransferase
MTAPNIAANTAIYGRSTGTKLTTTSITACLENTASSGKVYKINSILAANINGVNAADISISVYNGTTDWYIIRTLSVPADATQIVLTKENYIYLEEGISIRAQAGTANAIDVLISYEEIA